MTRWRGWGLATAILLAALVGHAQTLRAQTVGFEVDALPYLTGGYYGSAWYGVAPWRFRVVAARVNVPEGATQPQYQDLRLDAVAFIVDRFFGALAPALAGHWVGIGVESWRSRIEARDGSDSATYRNTVATLGGGYVWKFGGNWYLNLWGAAHYIVDGDQDVEVGNHTYHPAQTSGEISLKIGWHF